MDKRIKLSKGLRKSKAGDIIIVPLGGYSPHAVKLMAVYTREDGQIVGEGYIVEAGGCSQIRMGQTASVCLGWNLKIHNAYYYEAKGL